MLTNPKATIEDLYHVSENGKAELVDGELIRMAPRGFLPSRAASAIYVRLREYERHSQAGYALADNAGFIVNLPHRDSFSPDAAFYIGQPTGMRFLDGAPIFAVEVRSEGDYGPAAEKGLADKRAEYFVAGTLVVWDVNLLSPDVINVHRASDPNNPTMYRRGEIAEAEPDLPGWRMPVDELFKPHALRQTTSCCPHSMRCSTTKEPSHSPTSASTMHGGSWSSFLVWSGLRLRSLRHFHT